MVFDGEIGEFKPGVGVRGDEDGESIPAFLKRLRVNLGDDVDGAECGLGDFDGYLKFDGDPTGPAHGVNEVLRGVGGLDAASIDDDDLVASHLHFAENVGGEEDGMLFAEVLDEAANRANLVGVQSVRGLVKNQEVGFVNEGVGKSDPLPVSFGEGFNHFTPDIGQTANVENLAQTGPEAASAEAAEGSPKAKVFLDSHFRVKRDVLGHVADAPANFE